MSEYRRFIAYFYEYINGKKQKSAGFAKVELRSGVWRIQFRLNEGASPQFPAQIYGFVRTEGYLLDLPMGTMDTARQGMEERVYRADVPVAGNYRVEDLCGIRIEGDDGRIFLTVWDDEETDPARFVSELPRSEEPEEPAGPGEEPEEAEEERQEAVESGEEAEEAAESGEEPEEPEEAEEERQEAAESGEELEEPEETEEAKEGPQELLRLGEVAKEAAGRGATVPRHGEIMKAAETESLRAVKNQTENGDIQTLLRARPRCRPFQDDEITGCVMLKPCDVACLQQRGWQVGRSSFLQQGFYQYRHLLLGSMGDDSYVIGVPGVYNPREKYMAGLFGFDRFKESGAGRGAQFGYWYRRLERRV